MTYFAPIFAPLFAAILLIAYPVLTLVLLRRVGIRGPKLALALLPPIMMFLGTSGFHWFMASDMRAALAPSFDAMLLILIAKNFAVFVGAISPLVILAALRWPALDNSRLHREAFE
jgi:hypothetical protein